MSGYKESVWLIIIAVLAMLCGVFTGYEMGKEGEFWGDCNSYDYNFMFLDANVIEDFIAVPVEDLEIENCEIIMELNEIRIK